MTKSKTLPPNMRLAKRRWVTLRPDVVADDLRQVNQQYIDRHLMNRRLEVVAIDQKEQCYIVKDPGLKIGRLRIHCSQIIRPL